MSRDEIFDSLKEILSKTVWMSEREIIDKIMSNRGIFEDEREITSLVRKVLREETKDSGVFTMGARRCRHGATGYKIRYTPPVRTRTISRPETDTNDTLYLGKAAECAVMAELMCCGYNVNTMIVDEGIDIVASKDNLFHYIQVKSTSFELQQNGAKKFNYSIPKVKFDRVASNNVVYIFVVRGSIIGSFTYFKFSQQDINTNIRNGYINITDANININIHYDAVDGKPYLVNGSRKTVALSYENNFEL